MIPEMRQWFNVKFSDIDYTFLKADLEKRYGTKIPFRLAETPLFIPLDVKKQLIEAGNDVISFLLRPDFKELTDRAVPPQYKVPNESAHPMFLAIDFALSSNEAGEIIPQLIELQGFPSLFAFQDALGQQHRKVYSIPDNYTWLFNHTNSEDYTRFLNSVLLGGHDPKEVIMLDIDPINQATYVDFKATQEKSGIRPIGLEQLILSGKKLFYQENGINIPIKRIYNRVIVDELDRCQADRFKFHLWEDSDIEWAGHPNWFYRISKFIMPYLKGPAIPPSWFLNELKNLPSDLENYVLKPLYSFSGSGVIFNLTLEKISTIVDTENYILQKKVHYQPVLKSLDGLVKAEIRLLYIWEEESKLPLLVTNLCRLSKGDMIGVKFNLNKSWVGGTLALFE